MSDDPENDVEFLARRITAGFKELGDRLAWDETEVARDIFVRRIAGTGGLQRDADQLKQEAQYAIQAAAILSERLDEVVDTDD